MRNPADTLRAFALAVLHSADATHDSVLILETVDDITTLHAENYSRAASKRFIARYVILFDDERFERIRDMSAARARRVLAFRAVA